MSDVVREYNNSNDFYKGVTGVAFASGYFVGLGFRIAAGVFGGRRSVGLENKSILSPVATLGLLTCGEKLLGNFLVSKGLASTTAVAFVGTSVAGVGCALLIASAVIDGLTGFKAVRAGWAIGKGQKHSPQPA